MIFQAAAEPGSGELVLELASDLGIAREETLGVRGDVGWDMDEAGVELPEWKYGCCLC